MMSIEEYLALDRTSTDVRYEYIDGYAMRQAVDVYRRATKNLWTLHIFGPGDIVELTTLTISFPISSLYEDVTLPENGSDDPEFQARRAKPGSVNYCHMYHVGDQGDCKGSPLL